MMMIIYYIIILYHIFSLRHSEKKNGNTALYLGYLPYILP